MGTIRRMIDTLISQRSAGNSMIAGIVKTKLALKGIDSAKYTATTPDDPAVIAKLKIIISEMR